MKQRDTFCSYTSAITPAGTRSRQEQRMVYILKGRDGLVFIMYELLHITALFVQLHVENSQAY